MQVVHELIERFDAHLKAEQYYSVIANMRGDSPEAVAEMLMNAEDLHGLQGPTISTVYHMNPDGTAATHGFYAATICVHKKKLYNAVKSLQKVGGLLLVSECLSTGVVTCVSLLTPVSLSSHALRSWAAVACWCSP